MRIALRFDPLLLEGTPSLRRQVHLQGDGRTHELRVALLMSRYLTTMLTNQTLKIEELCTNYNKAHPNQPQPPNTLTTTNEANDSAQKIIHAARDVKNFYEKLTQTNATRATSVDTMEIIFANNKWVNSHDKRMEAAHEWKAERASEKILVNVNAARTESLLWTAVQNQLNLNTIDNEYEYHRYHSLLPAIERHVYAKAYMNGTSFETEYDACYKMVEKFQNTEKNTSQKDVSNNLVSARSMYNKELNALSDAQSRKDSSKFTWVQAVGSSTLSDWIHLMKINTPLLCAPRAPPSLALSTLTSSSLCAHTHISP